MKYSIHILLILLISAIGACVDDGRNPPPPVEGATEPWHWTTGNNDSTGIDPPADGSGGEQCAESWSVYQCRGIIIPYYYYMNGGAGNSIFFDGIDPDGVGPMLPQDPYICSDSIFVVGPDNDPNSEFVRDACKAQCDEEKGDLVFPASIGPYNFSGTVECVFDDNSNGGLPTSVPIGAGNVASCPWIDLSDPVEPEPQNLWDRDAEPADCEEVSCVGWDPNSWITWSYNTATKTHTTVFPGWFLGEMLEEQSARLYACDESRFYEAFVGGQPKGWIYAVANNDVLYRMGFRTGDYKLTVQRAGSPTNTIYPLDTDVQRVYAMAELAVGGSFVVKFRRPRSGGYDVHTMNLTLPAY